MRSARATRSATEERAPVAAKLHQYTGLPVDYILKADLRVNGPEFEKTLQQDTDTTTGRLDARFSGPTIDPLSKEADYDPMTAAIGSAYVSVFNDYVRKDLKFGKTVSSTLSPTASRSGIPSTPCRAASRVSSSSSPT